MQPVFLLLPCRKFSFTLPKEDKEMVKAALSKPQAALARRLRNTMLSQYDALLIGQMLKFGGTFNAHAHIDRANTLADRYLTHVGTTPLKASNLPLSVKQNLVGDYHTGPAYDDPKDLYSRMKHAFEQQIYFGARRIDTNIDATPDLGEGGLLAINIALQLKKEFAPKGLEIRVAPTPIFGFKKGTRRFEVFANATLTCDYISCLPEKDDFKDSNHDDRVGFKHHVRMGLELARDQGKEIQFHVDQMDVPFEEGSFRVLEVLESQSSPVVEGTTGPTVWLIHMISPSAYDEKRFRTLINRLLDHNVGVIICPTAALSMRQLRSVQVPNHNSIARVGELIKAKVPLRVGTDNIGDVFVPQGNGDMVTEVNVGDLALRLNLPHIWAKLACGVPLNNVEINEVGAALYQDLKANRSQDPAWQPAIE